jgi:hypothetical protein
LPRNARLVSIKVYAGFFQNIDKIRQI